MRKRVELVVFLTVFLDMVGFGIIIPLLPLYVQSMGGTAETVGVLLASFAATQLIATPLLGRLSDTYGRRPVILLSLVGNVLSMLAFAGATRANALELLFASRILAGATAGNLAACQAALADVHESRDRTRAMGRIGAGIGLGMVVGPLLGSFLAPHGPWVPPLGAAALGAVDLGLALTILPETLDLHAANARARGPRPTLGQVLAGRRVRTLLAIYFLTSLCLTNMQVALALLTQARLRWGAQENGYVFGLFGLAMLVVQGALIGPISARLGPPTTALLGAACVGAGLLGIGAAHGPPLLLGGCLFLAFGFGVINPVLSSMVAEAAPSQVRGAVLGFAQSAGGLARTVGPLWAGFLFARIAPGAPFFAGTVAAGVAAALLVRLPAAQAPTSAAAP